MDVSVVVVPALFTLCESEEDVLPSWLLSPLYSAVTAWVPTARLEMESVATPLASRADVPIAEPPSLNVTVPVAPEDGLTAAVNVTCCP